MVKHIWRRRPAIVSEFVDFNHFQCQYKCLTNCTLSLYSIWSTLKNTRLAEVFKGCWIIKTDFYLLPQAKVFFAYNSSVSLMNVWLSLDESFIEYQCMYRNWASFTVILSGYNNATVSALPACWSDFNLPVIAVRTNWEKLLVVNTVAGGRLRMLSRDLLVLTRDRGGLAAA